MKDDEKTGANEAANGADCVLDLDDADDWRYEDEWPRLDDAVRTDSPDVDVMDLAREGIDGLCEPVCRGFAAEPGGLPDEGEAAAAVAEKPAKPKPRGARNKELGAKGELAAALFLERRGYEIVEHNWRCPAGEADLIARDEHGTVVFVEVKTRSGVERGFPAEAVTPARRRRYERIAGYYLSDHVFEDARVRFDVLSILSMKSQNRAYIRHHVDAFGVG